MSWQEVLKIKKDLDEWFGNKARGEDGKTFTGWVSCQSCEDDKKGLDLVDEKAQIKEKTEMSSKLRRL